MNAREAKEVKQLFNSPFFKLFEQELRAEATRTLQSAIECDPDAKPMHREQLFGISRYFPRVLDTVKMNINQLGEQDDED